jgi:HK97 family phage major capsid protein
MDELKKVIEELGRAFEEFKSSHAEQIKELKAGRSDPLLEAKLQKISDRLDELSAQKDELEKKLNRPGAGNTVDETTERKALISFNAEIKAFAQEKGKAQPAEVTLDQYREYKRAFDAMMRGGEKQMLDAERKALSVGSDADGGYLVPPDTAGAMSSKLFDLSPIRQIANVQVISSDRLEGIEDIDEAAAGWVGETDSRSDTNTPRIGKYEIVAHEMYAQPKATQKLLDDAAVNVESWLANKVADKLARTEGAAYVVGNGVAKPMGFASYATAATADATRAWGTLEHVATANNGDFASSSPADVLFDVIQAMKPGYLANARWVTRRTVIAKVRKLKEATTNAYMWQPGLQAGQPDRLLGYPITMAEDMPALANGSLSMAFGDFRAGYTIVDRLGVRVLRDPYTDKPYVKFYTTKRTGGGVVNFEAIKFVKFGS